GRWAVLGHWFSVVDGRRQAMEDRPPAAINLLLLSGRCITVLLPLRSFLMIFAPSAENTPRGILP
ncbi:MAG: hypothetical protein M1376_14415, partial [Planctomycetes bacterium]|nr:hypothetical protein [Planctomycetota bacterium]